MLTEPPVNAHAFFAYARDRETIRMLREQGNPRPWTEDTILQDYRFCNIFREDDKVTKFLREQVQPLYSSSPALLLATIVFRWFNRPEAGRALFLIKDIEFDATPFELMLRRHTHWRRVAASAMRAVCKDGPYVTGAYIIKTPNGMDKLQGVLQCIEWIMSDTRSVHGQPYTLDAMGELLWNLHDLRAPMSLEVVWEWLRQFQYMGDFMAYEVVTDLSHGPLLDQADRDVWANPGPGAARGLGWVYEGDSSTYDQRHKVRLNGLMRELLALSRLPEYWPEDWRSWDMRTVEHTLCEFDKYQRVLTGQGRPRQRFAGVAR